MKDDNGNLCEGCGRAANMLRIYNEVTGVRPCVIKDEKGMRNSLEPTFTAPRELCFSCYNVKAKEYVADTLGVNR